jgi:ActR/RegA family two-component response regulator
MTRAASHILVVDDSPSFQQSMARRLTSRGYRVTCSSSGEDAAKKLQSTVFDLVVSDIILPGISGLNLLKLVKEHAPETEVIIVTGNASSFTAIKALRLGAYDYIVKPIDDDAILFNVVERTLEKQALSRENRHLIDSLSDQNRRLEQALSLMKLVNEVSTLIASSLDIGEILSLLVEQAVENLKAEKGYLVLIDRASNRFSMKVSVGIDHTLAKQFGMDCDRGISGLVAKMGEALKLGTDIPLDLTQRMLEEDESGELFSTPGILSVPLRLKDKVVGIVNVSGRINGQPFTEAETEFLSSLANHAAIALNNAGAFYRLRRGTS